MKNPQTTIALTFLTHIISAISGVVGSPWSPMLQFFPTALSAHFTGPTAAQSISCIRWVKTLSNRKWVRF